MGALWTVERTGHPRFPFRIAIEQEGRRILAVRAQSPWPGPVHTARVLAELSALHQLPLPFAFRELADRFPDVPDARVRRVLEQMGREGLVEAIGRGRGRRYGKAPAQATLAPPRIL